MLILRGPVSLIDTAKGRGTTFLPPPWHFSLSPFIPRNVAGASDSNRAVCLYSVIKTVSKVKMAQTLDKTLAKLTAQNVWMCIMTKRISWANACTLAQAAHGPKFPSCWLLFLWMTRVVSFICSQYKLTKRLTLKLWYYYSRCSAAAFEHVSAFVIDRDLVFRRHIFPKTFSSSFLIIFLFYAISKVQRNNYTYRYFFSWVSLHKKRKMAWSACGTTKVHLPFASLKLRIYSFSLGNVQTNKKSHAVVSAAKRTR